MKKNFIYNLINQIFVLIIPLITAPYLARVLGEVGNGQLSYSNSIITYFVLGTNLGYVIYGQREIARTRDNVEERSSVFWEISILRFINMTVSAAVLLTIFFTIGFGDKYNILILLLGIQIIATFFDISFYYQGVENFKGLAIRSVIVKLIGLVCIFIFVKRQEDLWIYALCLSLSLLFGNIIMWPSMIKQIKFVPIKSLEIKKRIWPSILIFLPTLAVTIYSVLDKTMIGLLSPNPDYDNGCYEQAYKLNGIALLLVTVISPIFASRNTYDYSHGKIDDFKKHIYFSSKYVWMVGLPLIAGFAVLSKSLSAWFLGEGYDEVPMMLIIMSVRFIASGFGVTFGDQLLVAIGKEKYATVATTIAALINFGLNFWLIPIYGGIGAAITTAIAEIIVTLILAFFVWKNKYVSIKKIIFSSWKFLVSAAVMFVPIYFIEKHFSYNVWSFLLITFIGACLYALMLIILREEFFTNIIMDGYKVIKSKLKKVDREEKQIKNDANEDLEEEKNDDN